MLLRLTVKNFLSFYEEVSFDMFPNLKRTTFHNHIYSEYDVPLLKQASIYGANGSGKSNFIETVRLIQEIATQWDRLEQFPIAENKFRLGGENNEDPICISMEFLHEKKYFIYKIAFDVDGITSEELLLSGIGKQEDSSIFIREGNKITSKYANTNEEIVNAGIQLLDTNQLVSLFMLMEKFPFFKDNSEILIAQSWFKNQLRVLSLRRILPSLIHLLSKEVSFLDYTNKIFKKIGIGIENISVDENILIEENIPERFKKVIRTQVKEMGFCPEFTENDKAVRSFEENEQGEIIVKQLLFNHLGIGGFKANLNMESQSDGTARLLNLMPIFYMLEKEPIVFFIDEIENSIHPVLMVELIKHFSESKTQGQLIYTTHQPELLNQQKILRPDEIWFAEKHEGQTKLYSLNDFKEHSTINIKNGYLDGRYGAIPFIGNLNEE